MRSARSRVRHKVEPRVRCKAEPHVRRKVEPRRARRLTLGICRSPRPQPNHSSAATTTCDPPPTITTYAPSSSLYSYTLPLGMWLACPECDRRCKNLGGLKRHQNSAHRNDPGLSIPVTELQVIYHPNLNGTYDTLDTLLSSYSPQAGAVISMEYLFRQTPHQKPQLSRQTTTGRLLHPGLVSNLRNLFIPMLNFRRER